MKNFQQYFLFIPLLIITVHAQNQTGFISLDCGRLPKTASYKEPTIGINYVSDEPYIETGESKPIQPEYKAVLQEQAAFVRAFPEGTRNCYKINVTKDTKYLIRASFVYGNYDGLNQVPEFELHLGPSFWSAVKIEQVDYDVQREIVHIANEEIVRVCLVNTGLGTPFISALEFRPLKNTSYVTPSVSLSLVLRADMMGSTSNGSVYRYPYDIHDRLWQPYNFNQWSNINTSLPVITGNNFQPPSIVMSTAATPSNDTIPLQIFWTDSNPDVVYFVYMYFAELQQLTANESRAFNIFWNDKLFYSSLVPEYLNTTVLHTPSGLSGGNFTFFFVRLENSTLPPIINAIEIYTALDLSQATTDPDDVDAITMIKSSYGLKRNWEGQGDPCLPVEFTWTGLKCTYHSLDSPRITSLNLTSSGLIGEISPYISNLTSLESLDLSNNNLTGSVPEFLSQLPNLKTLNLERNNLSGSLPAELVKKSESGFLSLSVGENPNLCSTVSCETTKTTKKTKKSNAVIPIVASVGGSVLILIIVVAMFAILKRKRKVKSAEQIESIETRKRQFTYAEVLKITRNFERSLGKGGFGTVYLGFLEENTRVAVKILSNIQTVQGSQAGEELSQQSFYNQQFQAEVKLLMRVHHTNLTSLVGYCNDLNNKALIYEYMENGDLESHILGDANVLSWEKRLQIAIDSAQGLEYLHTGCKPAIIHRDVKTTNILLNERFQAKIADFGLSKSLPSDENATHVLTRVAGTRGYLDPEYYSTNRLNEKSDVYSFGVVLLEIITGRPAISRTQDATHIIQWVNSMLSNGDINSIVEPKLRGNFESNSVWKAVELATACVSRTPDKRPRMSEVVAELKDCLAVELSRRNDSQLNASPTDSIEFLSLSMVSEINPSAR